jgi:2-polyprenyl-3-methyl-5-hydroxy-6-metoxy-1,4-benzoquinol methylase
MKTVNQKIVKFIKKYPLLFHSAKFVHKLLPSRPFLFHLLFDSSTIKDKWYREIKKTQINEGKPLFLDRQNEIKDFFNVNNFYLLKYYLKYGFPNTDKFKEHYIQTFVNNTDPDNLKKAYDSISFDYTLRLMLSYERYSWITDYLDFIIKDSGKNLSELKVLDYGCGVSDIGLFLSSFGAKVTIADLDNKRFDFVVWRFKKRGFNPETIRITETETYIDLPENKFDLIIATNFFEHVRDPLTVLKNFTKSLYKNFYNEHYIHVSPQELPYLFKKR